MKKIKIAILGATGHVAKNLIYHFSKDKNKKLVLFARDFPKLYKFLQKIDGLSIETQPFSNFYNQPYDVIINCVGKGNPKEILEMGPEIFFLTEEFDNIVLRYLKLYPKTIYINFSSGGVYSTKFNTPATPESIPTLNVNNISKQDYYRLAKINSEAKHRGMSEHNIIDLRIFGFYTRFIDLKTSFFLVQIINAIKNNKVFKTIDNDMLRDYIHPKDFIKIVELCLNQTNLNDVFDIYSNYPVSKFEILDYFKYDYDLKYRISKNLKLYNATGNKSYYYSNNTKLESLGYFPQFTSMDTIIDETKELID